MYFRKVAGALLSRVEGIMYKQGCVSQEQLWRGLSNTKHFRGALLALGSGDHDATPACIEPLLVSLKRAHNMSETFGEDRKYKRLFTQLLSLLADRSSGYSIGQLHLMLLERDICTTPYAITVARRHAEETFGGAPVQLQKHTRIVTAEATALDMSRHRFRHDVVQVNKGS